jgi:acyl carrier protein
MNPTDTLSKLTAHVREALNLQTISPDVAIGDLGFDSMRIVELILISDQLYDAAIDPEALELTQYTTLRDLDQQFRAIAYKNTAQPVAMAGAEG